MISTKLRVVFVLTALLVVTVIVLPLMFMNSDGGKILPDRIFQTITGGINGNKVVPSDPKKPIEKTVVPTGGLQGIVAKVASVILTRHFVLACVALLGALVVAASLYFVVVAATQTSGLIPDGPTPGPDVPVVPDHDVDDDETISMWNILGILLVVLVIGGVVVLIGVLYNRANGTSNPPAETPAPKTPKALWEPEAIKPLKTQSVILPKKQASTKPTTKRVASAILNAKDKEAVGMESVKPKTAVKAKSTIVVPGEAGAKVVPKVAVVDGAAKKPVLALIVGTEDEEGGDEEDEDGGDEEEEDEEGGDGEETDEEGEDKEDSTEYDSFEDEVI